MAKKDRLPHIFVPADRTDARPYKFPRNIPPPPPPPPPRNAAAHGAKLQQDLARVESQSAGIDGDRSAAGLPVDQGMLLTFEIEPGLDRTLDKLDRPSVGIELMSVSDRGNALQAVVFVPNGKLHELEKLIEQYRTLTHKGKPKNEVLGASLREIRRAVLAELWTDDTPMPADRTPIWWEVWLRNESAAESNFRALAHAQNVTVGESTLQFLDRIVLLAHGTAEQLASSVELLDGIAELRRAKELASFFVGLSSREQGDWVKTLASTIAHPGEDAHAVCLLDTGVNRGHPLLEPLLGPDDMHTVVESWGTADHMGHGRRWRGSRLGAT